MDVSPAPDAAWHLVVVEHAVTEGHEPVPDVASRAPVGRLIVMHDTVDEGYLTATDEGTAAPVGGFVAVEAAGDE